VLVPLAQRLAWIAPKEYTQVQLAVQVGKRERRPRLAK